MIVVEERTDEVTIPDGSVKEIAKYLTAFLSASEVNKEGDVYFTTYIPQPGEGWYFSQLTSQGFKVLKRGSQRRYVKNNIVIDLFLEDYPEITIVVSSSGVNTNPDRKEDDSTDTDSLLKSSGKRGYLVNKNYLSLSKSGNSYYIAYRTSRNPRIIDPMYYVPVPRYVVVGRFRGKVVLDADKFDKILKDKNRYQDLDDILGHYKEVEF